jgi:hypothetical protein
VTGLDAALASKASVVQLNAEANTRASDDGILQGNITTVSNNLTTETINRTNADTGLQTQINAKLSDAPSDGFLYGRKDAAWAKATGAVISATAPALPQPGTLWWDSDSGRFYVYFNDGNSSQWVQVNAYPVVDTSGFLLKTGGTMTGQLLLPTPGSNPAAAPKSYVDTGDAAVQAAIAPAVAAALAALQLTNFQAHRSGSGNLSITPVNTPTKIPMVAMVSPVGAWSINGTGGLVCPKTGTYMVNGGVQVTTTAATVQLEVGFLLNASLLFASRSRYGQGNAVAMNWMIGHSRMMNLVAGDVIYLAAASTVVNTAVDSIDATFFSASLVAAY